MKKWGSEYTKLSRTVDTDSPFLILSKIVSNKNELGNTCKYMVHYYNLLSVCDNIYLTFVNLYWFAEFINNKGNVFLVRMDTEPARELARSHLLSLLKSIIPEKQKEGAQNIKKDLVIHSSLMKTLDQVAGTQRIK